MNNEWRQTSFMESDLGVLLDLSLFFVGSECLVTVDMLRCVCNQPVMELNRVTLDPTQSEDDKDDTSTLLAS